MTCTLKQTPINGARFLLMVLGLSCLSTAIAVPDPSKSRSTEGGNGGNSLAGFLSRTYQEIVTQTINLPRNRRFFQNDEVTLLNGRIRLGLPIRIVKPSELAPDRFLDHLGKPATVKDASLLDYQMNVVDARVVIDTLANNDVIIQFDEQAWRRFNANGINLPRQRIDHLTHELFRYAFIKGDKVRPDDNNAVSSRLYLPGDHAASEPSPGLPYLVPGKFHLQNDTWWSSKHIVIRASSVWGYEMERENLAGGATCPKSIPLDYEERRGIFRGKVSCLHKESGHSFDYEVAIYSEGDRIFAKERYPRVMTQSAGLWQFSSDSWQSDGFDEGSEAAYYLTQSSTFVVTNYAVFREVYEQAIEHETDLNQRRVYELHLAAIDNDTTTITRLITTISAASPDWRGRSPVDHALALGHLEAVKRLAPQASLDKRSLDYFERYIIGSRKKLAGHLALLDWIKANDPLSVTKYPDPFLVLGTLLSDLDTFRVGLRHNPSHEALKRSRPYSLHKDMTTEQISLFKELAAQLPPEDNVDSAIAMSHWEDLGLLTWLLDNKITPTTPNNRGETIFGEALEDCKKDRRLFPIFMKHPKLDVTAIDPVTKWSPLSLAVKFDCEKDVKNIVAMWPHAQKGGFDYGYGPHKESLVALASRYGLPSANLGTLAFLVSIGVEPNYLVQYDSWHSTVDLINYVQARYQATCQGQIKLPDHRARYDERRKRFAAARQMLELEGVNARNPIEEGELYKNRVLLADAPYDLETCFYR